MNIQLTSQITVQPIPGMQMGNDALIGHAARVSTMGADTKPFTEVKEIEGLINYLMKHRHGTPFEHGAITFFVHAPIFVWREWHRHRIGFSYNEESARYKTLDPVFYLPSRERPMFKVEGWKPGRPKFQRIRELADGHDTPDAISHGQGNYEVLCMNLKDSYQLAYKNYLNNLEMGFDPGLARDCLPVGIYSSCWVTANPRSLMAFLSLRVHEPTSTFVSYPLHEIDDAARQVEELFNAHWPITHAAFVSNGRVAP